MSAFISASIFRLLLLVLLSMSAVCLHTNNLNAAVPPQQTSARTQFSSQRQRNRAAFRTQQGEERAVRLGPFCLFPFPFGFSNRGPNSEKGQMKSRGASEKTKSFSQVAAGEEGPRSETSSTETNEVGCVETVRRVRGEHLVRTHGSFFPLPANLQTPLGKR